MRILTPSSIAPLAAPALALALAFAAQPSQAATAPPTASTAPGEPRGLAAAFGNTIKAFYTDGRFQRLWLKPDGSWEAIGRRGKWSAGHWTQKGADKVCLKQSKPFAFPFGYCTDFPADGHVGAVWTSRSMEGDPIQVTVVKGIEKPQGERPQGEKP
ncbi:MAG: hypothetical protein JF588_08695 [Caulobacterales bacterium]|nr:hypothetical protein [Caulobacterales bacterium]